MNFLARLRRATFGNKSSPSNDKEKKLGTSKENAQEGPYDQGKELRRLLDCLESEGFGTFDTSTTRKKKQLRTRDIDVVVRVIEGCPQQDDLKEEKTIVRFFVSSTFTDTRYERDCFFAFCVPYLREISRSHELEFQVSEMRWGINDKASAAHETSALCMSELSRCARDSASTQFVGILGNKYGFRPFPAEIEEETFRKLMEHVEEPEHHAVLEKWFKHDSNNRVYALQPVYDLIPQYNPSVQDEYSKLWWTKGFEPMQQALRMAALLLERKDPNFDARPFIQSVTEDEMTRGFILDDTVLFIRDFEGAPIDNTLYADRPTEEDASLRLENLKEEMTEKATQVFSHSVKWESGGLDPLAFPHHSRYLASMLNQWTSSVEASIDSVEQFLFDSLWEEQRSHWAFCMSKVSAFVGRAELVQDAENIVRLRASGGVVLGPSGSGKTSVASVVAANLAKRNAGVTILRFLGTTARSKSVEALVRNICEQIHRAYNANDEAVGAVELPRDFNMLLNEFHTKFLTKGTHDKPLTLILDSLDQLDGASFDQLGWLPNDPIPHLCLLVTTLPNVGNLLPILYSKPIFTERVEVDCLDLEDIQPVMDSWLNSSGRDLARHQRTAIKEVVHRCESPTYLLLGILFNEAKNWRSYTPVPKSWNEIVDVPSAIHVLLDRLEARHGEKLTRKTLALLEASKDGLTSTILEDLLSLDNEVLDESFQWWVLPVARVPPLQVTRLLSDLKDYLVTKNNVWFHRQFREVSKARYGDNQEAVVAIAQYFGETVQLDEFLLPSLPPPKRGSVLLDQNRLIQSQPILFPTGTINKKKLRELPWALVAAKNFAACQSWLSNVEFIRSMFIAGEHDQDLLPLLDPLNAIPFPDLPFTKALHRSLVLSRAVIEKDPSSLEEQLWARLRLLGAGEEWIQSNLSPARKSRASFLIWDTPLETEPSLLFTSIGHTNEVEDVAALIMEDGKRIFISTSRDKTARIWNARGLLEMTLRGHAGVVHEVATLCLPNGQRLIITGSDEEEEYLARVWDASSGAEITKLNDSVLNREKFQTGWGTWAGFINEIPAIAVAHSKGWVVWDAKDFKVMQSVEVSSEGAGPRAISIVCNSSGKTIVLVGCQERSDNLHVYDFTSGKKLESLEGHNRFVRSLKSFKGTWKGKSDIPMMVTTSWDKTVLVWNLDTLQVIQKLTGHEDDVRSVCVFETATHGICIASGSRDSTIRISSLETGDTLAVLTGHRSYIHGLDSVVLEDGRLVLISGGYDHTVKVWDVATALAPKPKELAGHVLEVHALEYQENLLVSGGRDGNVKVWNISNGSLLTEFPCGDGMQQRTIFQKHSLAVVRVDKSQYLLGAGGYDQTLKIWDVQSRSLHATIQLESNVTAVAPVVTQSHNVFASFDQWDPKISVWSLPDGKHLRDISLGGSLPICATSLVHKKRDPPILAIGMVDSETFQGYIGIVDLDIGEIITTLGPTEASVTELHFSRCGSFLVGLGGPIIYVWSADSDNSFRLAAECRDHTKDVMEITMFELEDGTSMICSGSEDGTICTWQTDTGELRNKISHGNAVRTVHAYQNHPHHILIASGHQDGTINIWDGVSGNLVTSLIGARLTGSFEPINRIIFVPRDESLDVAICAGTRVSMFRLHEEVSKQKLSSSAGRRTSRWSSRSKK